MSCEPIFMSLRGHPKEAAAISPSLSVSTSTRRLLRRCAPRKDILISNLSSPMSLRFYFMSLRGHPKEAAAISPSLSVSTSTQRLLRRPSAEGLLAKTRLVAPFSPCHCERSFHVIASRSPYVIARPSQGGRGNLSVPLRIYEYEEIASSLHSSQRHITFLFLAMT